MKPLLLTLLMAALAASCAPAHVQLAQLPPDDAPLEQRRASYEQLRPIVVRKTDVARRGNGRLPSFIVLNDGTRVEHANDLVPVVAPGSPTAIAAARAEQVEARAGMFTVGGVILASVGVAMMLPALGLNLQTMADPASSTTSERIRLYALPVAAVGLVGSLATLVGAGGMVVGQATEVQAAQERYGAFLLYAASLKARLGLTDLDLEGEHPPATQDD
jgi:hypothetical protein